MRNHRPGTIQSAVSAALDATCEPRERLADFLGIRGSTLSYGTEVSETRPGGLGVNYLHRLAVADPRAALPIARHFCALAGGMFQPVVAAENVTTLYAHCSAIAKECGEAQAATIRAAECMSADALDAAERELDEAQAAIARARGEVRARRRLA
ncbi:hypothetical protein FIU97_14715 [Roseivivax sp. THAF40]|uniref:hypothetical protein n=1 Tax=Roseivivax sp. THAF40 TaxID=2587858 RepID=UPI0012694B9F|nr:hypothetical protein [Roseivivax sp. THAF40]QFT47832.1 hypothetical protein FIU97_14715 [Roseivivax sp. THAF40]